MTAPRDPPKWLKLFAALILLLIAFLAVTFAAALLGGLICGVSLRLHLSSTGFSCKYLPSILTSITFFAFLAFVPVSINRLQAFVARMYHVATARTNDDRSR